MTEMTQPQPSLSLSRVLKVVVPVAIACAALWWWSSTLESRARSSMASNVVARMFTADVAPTTATLEFLDADQDLVADPPADPDQFITPDVLAFSYVATEEEGPSDDTWKELTAALAEKTGKEVKVVHFTSADDQLTAFRNGELHIAGLNTGLVPFAVARDGFVPLCTFGRPDGSYGYTMQFLVPADSPIEKLADVKGHKVTFTRLESNSGCKAPLVVLKDVGLLPERDYQWGFSLGHEDSIKRVAAKEFEVAPVASDVVTRMVERGEVNPASFKSIYTSERFPPATIGYAYNLAPELAAAVRETLLGFDWTGTGLEKEFGPETTKFVLVNYKDDWANIRRIDQVIADARQSGGSG